MKRLTYLVAVLLLASFNLQAQWGPLLSAGRGGGVTPVTFSTTFNSGAQSPITTPWLSPVSTSASCNQTAGSKLEGEGTQAMAMIKAASYAFPADQEASITLDSTNTLAPGVRGNETTGAGYRAYVSSGGTALVYKSSAPGVDTQIGGDITISSHASGDVIKLRATGSSTVTLTVYVNGVSQGSVTDSTAPITSGQPFYQCNGFQTITAFAAASVP